MLIRVVNPNTTQAMTDLIASRARAVAGPGTRVEAVTSPMGPASIESHYDEALAVPGVLRAVAGGAPADGHVLACFGDPGLDAAREIADGPVVGIAEAAMRTATYLGRGFVVITTLLRTVGQTRALAHRYGVGEQCLAVRACEIPVLELDSDPEAVKRIVEQGRAAIDADGADVIVLGCAGMAGLSGMLSSELGVPVIDGVGAAVTTIESLVRLGVSTGRTGEYARPPAKAMIGALAGFGLEPAALSA